MPAEVEPPELARLVDFAERPRVENWSLRAALVRFAQPEPVRVEALLDVVRRIDWALHPQAKLLEREGPAVWAAVVSGEPGSPLVELLRAAMEVDHLGDVLAEWAVDRVPPRPVAAMDAVTADVAARLEALGIPSEDRRPPPARRRG